MDKKALKFIIFFVVTLLVTECIDQFWIVDPTNSPSFIAAKTILIGIISSIAGGCGLSAAWEIFCKKSFTQEVLLLNKMAESCYDGGIEFVYDDYNNINWDEELKNVKKFTIFFCYGYTWRNHNRATLNKFISNGGELNVILPDYTCKNLMKELDDRFGYGIHSLTNKTPTSQRIKEAYNDFVSIGANVKFHRRTLCSLYFILDEKAIFVPFRHCEKKIVFPAIRVGNNGHVYRFIKEDLDNLTLYDTPQNTL